MYTVNEYDIEVNHNEQVLTFHIKIIDSSVEVCIEAKHYFTLLCCTDEDKDTLMLDLIFENKGLDPKLVREIANVVESEKE